MVFLRYMRFWLKPEIYGPGYMGLIKQGFTETPVYLFSIPINILAVSALALAYNKWKKMEGHKRRFMSHYTVMRSDDPHKEKYFYLDVNDKSNIIDPARKCYYDV